MSSHFPTNLALDDDGTLLITWDDGREDHFAARLLREKCPCATCREKRKGAAEPPANPFELPVVTAEETQPTAIQGMIPVGNYAYTIAFSDGHDTGIFTLELLRELGSGGP